MFIKSKITDLKVEKLKTLVIIKLRKFSVTKGILMSAPKFVHLRVHSAYSLSEGAILVPKLIHYMHDHNIPAIAITDTANLFCGKALSKYASDEGVKPILGTQFFLRNPDADDLLKSKGRVIEPDKIIILVMNETGYKNLMHLMKRSYLDNPPKGERAQLKMSDLEELNEGLICLTAGWEGQAGTARDFWQPFIYGNISYRFGTRKENRRHLHRLGV